MRGRFRSTSNSIDTRPIALLNDVRLSRRRNVTVWPLQVATLQSNCHLKLSPFTRSHATALEPLRFRASCLFGSVLTKTDTEESDLDVLVESVEGTTLFILAEAEHEARQLTGVHISVLTPGFLSPRFENGVIQRAEPL